MLFNLDKPKQLQEIVFSQEKYFVSFGNIFYADNVTVARENFQETLSFFL